MATGMLTEDLFWTSEQCPFHAFVDPNTTADKRLMLVTGDNGSGKSYVVEYLRSWARIVHDFATISVSIRERTGAGLNDMAGMRRTFMFGDESEQSTGATSVRVVTTAFATLKSRIDDGKACVLVLDEPEMGLSRSFAGAMGQYIAQSLQDIGSEKAFVVVVSHNQALAQGMAQTLGHAPAFMHMQTAKTFEAWAGESAIRPMVDLLELSNADHRGRRAVWGLEAQLREQVKKEEAEDAAQSVAAKTEASAQKKPTLKRRP